MNYVFRFRQFSAPKWQDVRAQQLSGAAHMDAFFARSWEAEERRKGTGWGISRYNRKGFISVSFDPYVCSTHSTSAL